jgi:hypothetical protein
MAKSLFISNNYKRTRSRVSRTNASAEQHAGPLSANENRYKTRYRNVRSGLRTFGAVEETGIEKTRYRNVRSGLRTFGAVEETGIENPSRGRRVFDKDG